MYRFNVPQGYSALPTIHMTAVFENLGRPHNATDNGHHVVYIIMTIKIIELTMFIVLWLQQRHFECSTDVSDATDSSHKSACTSSWCPHPPMPFQWKPFTIWCWSRHCDKDMQPGPISQWKTINYFHMPSMWFCYMYTLVYIQDDYSPVLVKFPDFSRLQRH